MATINQIELRVNLRANNNEKSDQFGRLYAELDRNRTLSLRGLAKHISEHGSIYTRDIVEGVLTKLCQCIRQAGRTGNLLPYGPQRQGRTGERRSRQGHGAFCRHRGHPRALPARRHQAGRPDQQGLQGEVLAHLG